MCASGAAAAFAMRVDARTHPSMIRGKAPRIHHAARPGNVAEMGRERQCQKNTSTEREPSVRHLTKLVNLSTGTMPKPGRAGLVCTRKTSHESIVEVVCD